jgi:hypothetical protein
MNKCLRCGGEDIAVGKIYGGSDSAFTVFKPDGLRFFTLTYKGGTDLSGDSYACLTCGCVWSETDPVALKSFIQKHCKKSDIRPPMN